MDTDTLVETRKLSTDNLNGNRDNSINNAIPLPSFQSNPTSDGNSNSKSLTHPPQQPPRLLHSVSTLSFSNLIKEEPILNRFNPSEPKFLSLDDILIQDATHAEAHGCDPVETSEIHSVYKKSSRKVLWIVVKGKIWLSSCRKVNRRGTKESNLLLF
jgi:hypothetical protein